jgi:hypothetical protein
LQGLWETLTHACADLILTHTHAEIYVFGFTLWGNVRLQH